jgi:hypothetical protein
MGLRSGAGAGYDLGRGEQLKTVLTRRTMGFCCDVKRKVSGQRCANSDGIVAVRGNASRGRLLGSEDLFAET